MPNRNFVVLCDHQRNQCKCESLSAVVCNFALSRDILNWILIDSISKLTVTKKSQY